MATTNPPHQLHEEGTAIETLQSLIIAFVLAMTFRGFVTEGFVIPTGSMAPTLLGQHYRFHSRQTGATFPIDARVDVSAREIYDPKLGPRFAIPRADRGQPRNSMGDRILVLKCLYPFFAPKRFDVVVFKNPTNPDGKDENYIKRLVGLPDEKLLLVDGDVFVGDIDAEIGDLKIQRKPLHIQRAVWQTIYDSDFMPLRPDELDRSYSPPFSGQDWNTTAERSFRCDTAEPSTLEWDLHQIPLTDWTSYDMLMYSSRQRPSPNSRSPIFNISDLRVSAGIVADQPGFETTLELVTRGHRFEFILKRRDGTGRYEAIVQMTPIDDDGQATGETVRQRTENIELRGAGRVVNVEFWHVDQSLSIYLNGKRAVGPLEYDWRPRLRMENAYQLAYQEVLDLLPRAAPNPARLMWHFRGSPVTLHRVRVDRDLYYQPARLNDRSQKNQPALTGWAFGTHPNNPAILESDQFLMLGDNSPFSSDSRLWGSPAPIVAAQIDDAPFIVNRKLLLGKAWVVYFPAPYPLRDGGRAVIPDFGRLRFIR